MAPIKPADPKAEKRIVRGFREAMAGKAPATPPAKKAIGREGMHFLKTDKHLLCERVDGGK